MDRTKCTYSITDAQRKENSNRETALERSVGKTTGRGGWLKPVLTAQNLALKSDAAVILYSLIQFQEVSVCAHAQVRL